MHHDNVAAGEVGAHLSAILYTLAHILNITLPHNLLLDS